MTDVIRYEEHGKDDPQLVRRRWHLCDSEHALRQEGFQVPSLIIIDFIAVVLWFDVEVLMMHFTQPLQGSELKHFPKHVTRNIK